MTELSRYLFLAGAAPFLVLGAAHVIETPLATTDRKGLSPSDASLPGAMARSAVRLTRRTDMWRAWVGFNLSHSLGALAFGAFVVASGASRTAFAQNAGLALPLAVVVSSAYLWLGIKYWFRTPILGCGFGVACFLAAFVLGALGD